MRSKKYLKVLRDAGGMSLTELAAVLGIIGLILTLAVPSYQSRIRDQRVDRVARDIAGLLRLGQQLAVGDSLDACGYRVAVIATSATLYSVARDPATRVCASPEVLGTLRVTDTFPNDVTVTPATVQFASAGRLTSGTTVRIGVSSGSRTRTVSVDPATGSAEVTE